MLNNQPRHIRKQTLHSVVWRIALAGCFMWPQAECFQITTLYIRCQSGFSDTISVFFPISTIGISDHCVVYRGERDI